MIGYFYVIDKNLSHHKISKDTLILDSINFIEYEEFVEEIENYKICNIIEIDSIADIDSNINERSSLFIKKRIEALIGRSLKERTESRGCEYPPKFVLFRAFKADRIFEIWAGNNNKDSLKLIITLQICAADFDPGPKLQYNDYKTPEGFYNCMFHYYSSYSVMWMKLNREEIGDWGEQNYGSAFRLCIDYPLNIDKRRTRKYLGSKTSPGGSICIHPNCVSAGCLSFKNKDFLPIFLFSRYHNKKAYGPIKIHIFPFYFVGKYQYPDYVYGYEIDSLALTKFWSNLETGFKLFNKKRRALKIGEKNDVYTFSLY